MELSLHRDVVHKVPVSRPNKNDKTTGKEGPVPGLVRSETVAKRGVSRRVTGIMDFGVDIKSWTILVGVRRIP